MSRIEKRFINCLRYLLISQWDPIGVSNEPDAYSEYDVYIPRIRSSLASNVDSASIASLLYQIEADSLELPGDRERASATARAILEAHHHYRNRLTIPCYTQVRIVTDRYRNENAPLGTPGYIIEIYTPDAYEIECSGVDGVTFAQVVVHPDEIVPYDIDGHNQSDQSR